MAHDVFISHSSKDKTVADAVCSLLEQNKIRCWIAPRDVIPGRKYAACITEAIKESKVLIIIFSSNSNQSGSVTNELEIAMKNGVVIIPFRIEQIEPSDELEYYLSSRHWLDAITPPLEDHIIKLVENINRFFGVVNVKDAGKDHTGKAEKFTQPNTNAEAHVTKFIFNKEIPSRDSNFIGRENEICSFMKALVNRKAIGIMGFQGMGGMGKTAIAIEICNIFKDGWRTDPPRYPDYLIDILRTKKYFRDGILWIRLERDESLPTVLETMGHQLGIHFSVKDNNKMTSQIRDSINQLDLLLVIDSAEQNKDNLRYLLKAFSEIPILVTSRERLPGLRMISIDAMPKEDAVNLFIEYLGRDLLSGEEDEIIGLCEQVGYLPLAVKILSCRAYENDRRVSDLAEDFRRKRLNILTVSSLTESEKKNLDVNTCLVLSYERLTIEQKRLLTVCGMFGFPISQDKLFSLAEKVSNNEEITEEELNRRFDELFNIV